MHLQTSSGCQVLLALSVVIAVSAFGQTPEPDYARRHRGTAGDIYGVEMFAGVNFSGPKWLHHCATLCDLSNNPGMVIQASSLWIESGRWTFCSEGKLTVVCATVEQGEYPDTRTIFPPALSAQVKSMKRVSD